MCSFFSPTSSLRQLSFAKSLFSCCQRFKLHSISSYWKVGSQKYINRLIMMRLLTFVLRRSTDVFVIWAHLAESRPMSILWSVLNGRLRNEMYWYFNLCVLVCVPSSWCNWKCFSYLQTWSFNWLGCPCSHLFLNRLLAMEIDRFQYRLIHVLT